MKMFFHWKNCKEWVGRGRWRDWTVGLDLQRDADLSVFLRQEKLSSSSFEQKEGHELLKSE